MKFINIFIRLCLATGFALLAIFFPIYHKNDSKILLVQDPLSPMPEILRPFAADKIQQLNPYLLGHRLPGLNGMAFVLGPQARHYQKQSASMDYIPLSTVTMVIAINQNYNSAKYIDGWQTLLESEAIVLIPCPAMESGRLAAIALARGLHAIEGDFTPAIEAFAHLQSRGRLNHQDEYKSRDYRNMVPLENMLKYDAILLWDYQATALMQISDNWRIIIPKEGTLSVDWGFISGGNTKTQETFLTVKEFLLSEQGRQTLLNAGFSPFIDETDLSVWEQAKLTYNPRFRRKVLAAKLYSPASVQERLLLQSITLFLFCIAAQKILRRIPRGIYRKTSFYSIFFVSLWMLIGIAKTLALEPGLARYFWFATYIPRHLLPVCWFCMCYTNRYGRPPDRDNIMMLISVSILLTVLVFTNDAHQLVFAYKDTDPWSWTRDYINGPGYHISVLWSFSLGIAGLILLIYKTKTRRQKRQMLYAAVLFLMLLIYQTLYITGIEQIIDLDIPTTIAVFILVFNFAAQRERFMGASLLDLPIFNTSPHAIAIYDTGGRTVYANAAMGTLQQENAILLKYNQALHEIEEIPLGKQMFKSRIYTLNTGKALALEDITYLKQLEKSLKETHQKLKSVQKFLIHHAEEARNLTNKLEQERYSSQMNLLFKEKLEGVRRQLQQISKVSDEKDTERLRLARFLLCICQQRLGFIIRSLEVHPLLPLELIERYVSGIMKDGRKFGLDSIVTVASGGFCHSCTVEVLLETIDSILLYAFVSPGSSVIYRLEANNAELSFNGLFSWEGDTPPAEKNILPGCLIDKIKRQNGQIYQKTEKDGIMIRFLFPNKEVKK